MSARVYDLQAHPSRQGHAPKLFVAGPPFDRYEQLAEETAETLAAVVAAVPDGRSNRALLGRLADLTGAIKAMRLTEIAVRELYYAGLRDGAAEVLGTGGQERAGELAKIERALSGRHLRAVDDKPGGAA